jgi:cysteine desulfurase/selenocysteine lyase
MRKRTIYFDNAATTFPKPASVISAMTSCMENFCANPGRSGHSLAMLSDEAVFRGRLALTEFFNGKDPLKTVFMKNATEGLNMVIGTLAAMKGHVVFTSYEHNSVIRPVYHYAKKGLLSYDICLPDPYGRIYPKDIESKIQKNTLAVIVSLASNITGYILPVKEIGELCKDRRLFFVVDVSQGAGTLRPDMIENNIHVLVGTGHKDLYGPQGTGFVCTNEFDLIPILYGGTGTDSMLPDPANVSPDMLEAGTLNLPGIVGLTEGVRIVSNIGSEKIHRHKKTLISRMLMGLENIKGITPYVPEDNCGIVSFDIDGMDSQEAVHILSSNYGICARGGFHCSPNLHRYLKTEDKGLVRFSFGIYNHINGIDYALDALERMVRKR